jgi:hypothetical protein
VKDQVRIFMKDFRTFGSPLLDIAAADPDINSTDANIFHIDIERAEPSVSETVITDPVVEEHQSLVGGYVEFVCRPSHDSKNPSKHEDSDSIKLAFLIQPTKEVANDPNPNPNPNPNPTPETDGLPDPDSNAIPKDTFTKAVFVKNFAAGLSLQTLVIILWYYQPKLLEERDFYGLSFAANEHFPSAGPHLLSISQ